MTFNYAGTLLCVPAESLDAYTSHTLWGKFGRIESYDPSGVPSLSLDEEISLIQTESEISLKGCNSEDPVSIYSLEGKLLSRLMAGDGTISYPFEKGRVYIIHTPRKKFKVRF